MLKVYTISKKATGSIHRRSHRRPLVAYQPSAWVSAPHTVELRRELGRAASNSLGLFPPSCPGIRHQLRFTERGAGTLALEITAAPGPSTDRMEQAPSSNNPFI